MKNNTAKSRQLIEQAMRELPDNFALRDVRYNLARALTEIGRVEKKRGKREVTQMTPHQKWEMDKETNRLMPPNLTEQQKTNVIGQIDAMISAEQQKIDKPKASGSDGLIVD